MKLFLFILISLSLGTTLQAEEAKTQGAETKTAQAETSGGSAQGALEINPNEPVPLTISFESIFQ